MEKWPKGFRFRRMLLQFGHGSLKDFVRKGMATLLRGSLKGRLKFPFTVLIEVTNDCQLDCVMCPHSRLEEKTGYMPFGFFRKIIDECSRHISVGEMIFSGIGEPLMHPQLLPMGQYAKSKGIPNVRLITNALFLTREKTLEILEAPGFDEIAFSLDALTPETYQKVKKRPVFQMVEENIRYFLAQKRPRGRPFVSLHILKMEETVSEIDGFLEKWGPLLGRGDHIMIKDVHPFAGQMEDRRLEEQVYRAERHPCTQLWKLMDISWNGDVMPCCMDPFKRLKVGNLRTSSLEELWNGPSFQNLRTIHLQGRYEEIPLCHGCENWWYLGKEPQERKDGKRTISIPSIHSINCVETNG